MESNLQAVPIEPQHLEPFNERADRLLASVKWAPRSPYPWAAPASPSSTSWRESTTPAPAPEELSLLRFARALSGNSVLLTESLNHALTVVHRALRIGMHLSRLYTRFSGLDQLVSLNERGGLTDAQKSEFRSKYQTASAIAIFSAAYYVVWELGTYKAEELGGVKVDFAGIPEVSLQDPVRAVDCLLFYYAAYLEKSGAVRTDLDLLRMTLLYFQAAVDEIKLREESLRFVEPFTSQTYRLQNSEFALNGFKVELNSPESSIEFNRVELSDIVGNRDAKHEARRLVSRLLCYDLQSKRNPVFDLGGLSPVSLGYGEPGTGKSMLISATATMLADYCKELQLPFLFWPMPDTVVSTYQGGSAERMMAWMKPLKDASRIIYAPIDDAENNLEERTRPGVSAGVREVIGVFLRNTEGAYAVNRGNTLIQLFTNLPDQIDRAVLSRINSRFYIGGARTRADFLDQDYLWLKKYRTIESAFVAMHDPSDYPYLSEQALLGSLSQLGALKPSPEHPALAKIVASALAKRKLEEHAFFGELYAALKASFPYFTSRDVRNIQRAIDGRIMDFDLPDEWFSSPEQFFKRSYDDKRGLLVELMKQNMRGLTLAEIRYEESIRYLNNMIRIAEEGRERRVQAMAEELSLRREAETRFLGNTLS